MLSHNTPLPVTPKISARRRTHTHSTVDLYFRQPDLSIEHETYRTLGITNNTILFSQLTPLHYAVESKFDSKDLSKQPRTCPETLSRDIPIPAAVRENSATQHTTTTYSVTHGLALRLLKLVIVVLETIVVVSAQVVSQKIQTLN